MKNTTNSQISRSRRDERGLSVLELTLMLAALVIVSAALTPALLRMVHQSRQDRVQAELESLHHAMLGSDAQDTFGYVGDVGRLPFDLTELTSRGDLPLFNVSQASGVGYGWNGPYVTAGRDEQDFRLDPWGNSYDLGLIGVGQVRSAGANGLLEDEDDIVYPPQPLDIYGSLIVTVKGRSDAAILANPEGCVVTLHYAANGLASTVVDETVPYSFTAVHRGLHTVQVSCTRLDGAGSATQQVVTAVRGGGAQQAIELYVDLGVAPGASAAPERSGEPAAASTSMDEGSQSDQR